MQNWGTLTNLEITADYFHIDDRIVFSGNFTGARILPLIQQLGATAARFFKRDRNGDERLRPRQQRPAPAPRRPHRSIGRLQLVTEPQLPLDDQTFSAEWLADLEVGYRWQQYTLAVGAENLFDNFPDRTRVFREGTTAFTAPSKLGMFIDPSHSPFGMNGRFVYTRVTYTF